MDEQRYAKLMEEARRIVSNADDERLLAYLRENGATKNAVRYAAGLAPAWSSYDALSGPILASQNQEARQKLDDAVYTLLGRTVSYSGEAPAQRGLIRATQFQQIRDGVR